MDKASEGEHLTKMAISPKLARANGAVLAIVSLVIMGVSMAQPWGSMDVNTNIGILPVTLKAQIYEYGIDYNANLTGAGLLGGGNVPSTISNNKVFLTGLGDFQQTIGFLKGTSKEKASYVTEYTWPPPTNGTAEVRIITTVDTIPWWPVGLAQGVGLSVEVLSATNMSELKAASVEFELHRVVKAEDGTAQDLRKQAWKATPGDVMTKVGDKRSYHATIAVDEDYGEFFVVGKVSLELKDSFGNTNSLGNGTYRELAPPPKEIKLWTMSTGTAAQIALMVAAFPLTVTSVILMAAGTVLGLAGGSRPRAGRWAWKVCTAALVLALLAVAFYVVGMNALFELTGHPEWLEYGTVLFVAALGACLYAGPAALFAAARPPAERERPKRPEQGKECERKGPGEKERQKEERGDKAAQTNDAADRAGGAGGGTKGAPKEAMPGIVPHQQI